MCNEIVIKQVAQFSHNEKNTKRKQLCKTFLYKILYLFFFCLKARRGPEILLGGPYVAHSWV